jgi:intracellular multiplication protein IcmO
MNRAPSVDTRTVSQDTRPVSFRFREFARDAGFFPLFVLAGLCAFPPLNAWADLVLPIATIYFLVVLHTIRHNGWPLRAPCFANTWDPKDLDERGNPQRANGIYLVGFERDTGAAVWLTNVDLRADLYILGAVGSGKTESLMAAIFNACILGSAAATGDGKGELATWEQIYGILRRFGREDDVFLLSYVTSGRDIYGSIPERRLSNTDNPLALWDSSALSELLMQLLDKGSVTDPFWIGRAESYIRAILPPLVWRRDQGVEPLSPAVVRRHLDLDTLQSLALDKTIPPRLLEGVVAYLRVLPGGWDPDKPPPSADVRDPQAEQAPNLSRGEQHAYVTMQLTNALGLLADSYAYITNTPYPEIDWYDAVVNRRFVVVILPALGKSVEGAAALGRIFTANIKGVMARVAGSQTERRVGEVAEPLITKADHPYFIIMDEKPAYVVDGEDIMYQEARSLGFALFVLAQGHQHMINKNKTVADAIAGLATLTKLFLGVEDIKTMELARKLTGEVWRAVPAGYNVGSGIVPSADNRLQLQKDSWLDPLELKAQHRGQGLLVNTIPTSRGEIQRAVWIQGLYIPPVSVLAIHQNHLQPLLKPQQDETAEIFRQVGAASRTPKEEAQIIADSFGERMIQARQLWEKLGLNASIVEQHELLQETVERVIMNVVEVAPCPMDQEGERLLRQLCDS